MEKVLAVGLTIVVALGAITAAGAAQPNPRVARLSEEVRALRLQLKNMTLARASLRAQNASLKAQLELMSTPLAAAEEQVGREVGWSEEANPSYPVGELTALAAMNYVDSHVSSTAYAYAQGLTVPAGNGKANAILAAQAGECVHHVVVFVAIMRHLGYLVRRVGFSYVDPRTGKRASHTGVEVYYDGDWHYYDPTFGLYWTDPATGNADSITQERESGGTEHKDGMLFLNLFEDPWYGGDDTAFETDPKTVVTLFQAA